MWPLDDTPDYIRPRAKATLPVISIEDAKAREAKLIKAAYNQGAFDNIGGEYFYPLEGHEDARLAALNKEIYNDAGLGELK